MKYEVVFDGHADTLTIIADKLDDSNGYRFENHDKYAGYQPIYIMPKTNVLYIEIKSED